ncbi:MAG: tyrosine-type recombinase/integrase [Acidobacteriia bacterium]|nr:tyrosine-type recombinase/integrase [Terriglobia bacterium]
MFNTGAERGNSPLPEDPLFRNRCGTRLTRFGVRYILRKHCARAQAARPALPSKRLHPHCMRHSTAVHLLRAGVDTLPISQCLARQCHHNQPICDHRSRDEAKGHCAGPRNQP